MRPLSSPLDDRDPDLHFQPPDRLCCLAALLARGWQRLRQHPDAISTSLSQNVSQTSETDLALLAPKSLTETVASDHVIFGDLL